MCRENLGAIHIADRVNAACIERHEEEEEGDAKAIAHAIGGTGEGGDHGSETDEHAYATGLK